MKPFISLCMIVKNEEKVIGRCLSSVAHLVDEVIIVDTGSIDKTKQVVSNFTSKVYDFTWVNDFSAARNFAASKASGEWILVLDADEYIDEENFEDFKAELKRDNGIYDAYTAKILNFTGNFGENLLQNHHDRVYKNNAGIIYYRKIHEQFKNINNEELHMKNSPLLIFHSGYLNYTVGEKKKSERNKELLDKEISSGANKAFDYFNYGNEYYSMGDFEKALDTYLKAYRLKNDFRLSWVSTTLIQIIICLINLKKYNNALDVIGDAEKIYTNSPEFPYLKGEIFLLRGQVEDAKNIFQHILENNKNYFHIILRPDLKEQMPHIKLGEIYLYEEDYQKAIYHYSSVLNMNKYNEESINKVIYILDKFHSSEEISNFAIYKNLVNDKNIKAYIKACLNIGNPNLALKLIDDYREENELLYKIILLKSLCINKEGSLENLEDVLEYSVLQELMRLKWVNLVDLFLLKEFFNDNSLVTKLMKNLEEDRDFNTLIMLLNKQEFDGYDINLENLLIFTLRTLIHYKQSHFSRLLLDQVVKLNKVYLPKVAALLFSHGYKIEALQLYEAADWNDFAEQDFINIIKSLIQSNNIKNALEIAYYSISIYEKNFNFYSLILENTMDENLFVKTLNRARELFQDSPYLDRQNSLFLGSIERVDKD
jgi:glycosyltransferase involved in cell wall biosynthesis